MTVHGDQYLLPFFIKKDSHHLSIQGNEELCLAFYLLTKKIGKSEKIISFSRLLWPILSIHGMISTHIMLDGLNLLNKKGKFSNPPRQPLIGHILRNVENKTKNEQLNKLIDILSYKDTEAEELGEEEESEFHLLKIDGLINPEFLQTLNEIIHLIEYKPILDFTVLDTSISTETALNISEEYRQIINLMKGNALRWNTQIELIEKEVSKWLIDLNVQLKDLNLRYSSQITKTSSSIDAFQVDEQTKIEQDKIDQWNVSEKKKIIESISTLFKTSERHLEETIKKNRLFTNGESLKGRVFKDILPLFENQFINLKSEGNRFLESLESLIQRFNELKERSYVIDNETKRKLEDFQESLRVKLKDRDKLLSKFESEKNQKITQLESSRSQIENLFKNIKEFVQVKYNTCLQEAQNLTKWALNDNQSDLFSRPVQWVYMPTYVMFIEDENDMEEYMNIIFPGYITDDPDTIYEDLSDAFRNLKNMLSVKVENDMKTRSNFEFACERQNLIKDPSLKKRLQMGISKLREKNLLSEVTEKKIRENYSLLP